MKIITRLRSAQRLALQGKTDEAKHELVQVAELGDGSAHASLAEIAAYQGDWSDVLAHAAAALKRPADLYSMNVYVDLCLLAVRAGRETGDWQAVADIAVVARAMLPVAGDASTEAWQDTADSLGRAAGCHDSHPLELPPPYGPEARRLEFEAARSGLSDPKTLKRYRTEAARADSLYALARTLGYPQGALEQWDTGSGPPTLFEHAAFLASALSANGSADAGGA